jgi:hypothetical protein
VASFVRLELSGVARESQVDFLEFDIAFVEVFNSDHFVLS